MYDIINKIGHEVRLFFERISWGKILTFSFFVLISSTLWFTLIYKEEFETNITIPIKYVSIPDSIVFRDSLPSTIKIRIKDDGIAMFRYYFKKNDTLLIDVAKTINGGTSKILQGGLYEQSIRASLPYSSKILNYSPIKISFNFAKLAYKKVPVVFDGQINLASGYFLSNDIKIYPDSITAYGAKSDLDKLVFAYTVNDTVKGIDENTISKYHIENHPNIKFAPNIVTINVPVEAYTQKIVDIPISCLNLPENLNVKFFPSKVKLSFFVGVSKADSIQADDFSVAVDYNELKSYRDQSTPVRITLTPGNIKNLIITPPNVEYIFEHKY